MKAAGGTPASRQTLEANFKMGPFYQGLCFIAKQNGLPSIWKNMCNPTPS